MEKGCTEGEREGYGFTKRRNEKPWRVCFSQHGAMGLGSHVGLCVTSVLVSFLFGERRFSLPCMMGKGFIFVECFFLSRKLRVYRYVFLCDVSVLFVYGCVRACGIVVHDRPQGNILVMGRGSRGVRRAGGLHGSDVLSWRARVQTSAPAAS